MKTIIIIITVIAFIGGYLVCYYTGQTENYITESYSYEKKDSVNVTYDITLDTTSEWYWQSIELGQVWYNVSESPFDDTLFVKIVAIKDGWVQYIFRTKYGYSTFTDSKEIMDLLKYWKEQS